MTEPDAIDKALQIGDNQVAAGRLAEASAVPRKKVPGVSGSAGMVTSAGGVGHNSYENVNRGRNTRSGVQTSSKRHQTSEFRGFVKLNLARKITGKGNMAWGR